VACTAPQGAHLGNFVSCIPTNCVSCQTTNANVCTDYTIYLGRASTIGKLGIQTPDGFFFEYYI
jgi:hypothetical protein